MNIYKTYFLKSDTPFNQTYQRGKKYHTCWYSNKLKKVNTHKVYKVKLFGIITVYTLKRGIKL